MHSVSEDEPSSSPGVVSWQSTPPLRASLASAAGDGSGHTGFGTNGDSLPDSAENETVRAAQSVGAPRFKHNRAAVPLKSAMRKSSSSGGGPTVELTALQISERQRAMQSQAVQ